jgi:hypothetical protein
VGLMESHWHIRDSGLLDRWAADLRTRGRLVRWGHRAEIDVPGVGAVHLIIAGSVQIQGTNGLVRLDRGDIWGVNKADVSLRAFDDTTVLDLADEHLGDGLGEMIARIGVLKPRTVSIPIQNLIHHGDEARVVKVLLHLAPESLESGTQMIELEIRARHVSQLTGIPLIRTRTILENLKRSKLVKTGRRGLVIPDLDAIRAFGEVNR